MLRIIFYIIFFDSIIFSSYLSNKSCKECHKDIYNEYQYSYHSKGYFNDILHRKIADNISLKKYDCAICHMPAANDRNDIINGTKRPNKDNLTNSDAISCFFCHEIAYVKKAHKFNLNITVKQKEGLKPTLFGSLKDPDENDKHFSVKSPIYEKYVCSGCHSHKRNKNDLLIYDAMGDKTDSKECIKCHMPYINGGNENMNKRARTKHRSHYFFGIHSNQMRQKAVDIKIKINKKNCIMVTLKNRMPHPLIIQSAREMYMRVELYRDDKLLWSNKNDRKSYFMYDYLKDKKPIVIPYSATSYSFLNNLMGGKQKVYKYYLNNIKKGDKIVVSFYMIIAKKECLRKINLLDSELDKPLLSKKVIYQVK